MSLPHTPIRFRKLPGNSRQSGIFVWFPYAGGTSAAVIRQTSGQELGMQTWIGVLPGREERHRESAIDLQSLVREFDEALDSETDQPLILAGHSFGGLLAYLLAKRRCERGLPPRGLALLAVAPPDRLSLDDWSDSEDHKLIEYLDQKYGAIPAGLRNNHDLLRCFLPVVRHDLRLMESYRHQPTEPLPLDLVICGGTEDQALPASTLADWQRFTQAGFTLKMFSGDHFFPHAHFGAITNLFSAKE
jgi:surfactin synthase thioesterase subunit